MKITVATRLVYACRPGTHVTAVVQTARSPDQRILRERLTLGTDTRLADETDAEGIRWLRGEVP